MPDKSESEDGLFKWIRICKKDGRHTKKMAVSRFLF